MHCHTTHRQWAAELVPCTASVIRCSRQWILCNASPHCLAAVGNGTPSMYCGTAQGQWVVEVLQCTASLPGAMGSGTPTMHCHTA